MQKNLVEEEISRLIKDSIEEFKEGLPGQTIGESVKFQLEIPKSREHGDLFTNVGLRLCAAPAHCSPMEAALQICALIEKRIEGSGAKEIIKKIEVKPPGFINFWLADKIFHDTLKEAGRAGSGFGRGGITGPAKKILIEFVSANPTGPLTIAHARQAAFGGSLANALKFCGDKVVKEYYINDEGVQMSVLAESVLARYLELAGETCAFPENGYKGKYIYEIAEAIRKRYKTRFVKETKARKALFLKFSCEWIMATIKKDLADFNVSFDNWYSQARLARSGNIEKAISILRDKNYIYDNEGASWLRSSAFGDEKDRVAIKSDGSYTYLAPDIAYHKDKFKRGFDKLIDIWGPDHHGYIPRIKAAIQALGYKEDALSVIIIQLATLFREGKPVSMSTRQGEFITLRELMDEVGKDAGRFMLLTRRSNSHLDFDLELAKKQSPQNPVYYVQYAHARICSILEKAVRIPKSGIRLELLKQKEEIELIKLLWKFPYIIKFCRDALEPHGLAVYLQELAAAFHYFYDRHRVIGEEPGLTAARLFLINCARLVLANGLDLLGVSAPKKM